MSGLDVPQFRIQRPCSGCPFRADGSGVKLVGRTAERVLEQVESGDPFACHQTTTQHGRSLNHPRARYCAGSMLHALARTTREDRPLPPFMLLGLLYGAWSMDDLSRDVPVAETAAAFRALFRGVAAAVRREVRDGPTRAAPVVLGMVIVGIRRGVYDTPPGKYVRTQDLLRESGVRPLPRRPGVGALEVYGLAEYASQVEFGSGEGALPEPLAVARAERLGAGPAPLYLGRTGQRYTVANPALTRATVYATALMGRQLQDVLRARWAQARQATGKR